MSRRSRCEFCGELYHPAGVLRCCPVCLDAVCEVVDAQRGGWIADWRDFAPVVAPLARGDACLLLPGEPEASKFREALHRLPVDQRQQVVERIRQLAAA